MPSLRTYYRSQIMLFSSLRYDVLSVLYRIGTVRVNLHVVHMQPRPAPLLYAGCALLNHQREVCVL
jgi:hypothetical protein